MKALFIIGETSPAPLDESAVAPLRKALADVPNLVSARLMIPDRSPAEHPFAQDGAGPALALELYFQDAPAVEAAAPRLRSLPVLSSLPSESVSYQLMTPRDFPTGAEAPPDPCCVFLVTYPGTAEDREAWLDHYDAYHPPIMTRFPRIREVETCRPVDWSGDLPWPRRDVLQRNKVVFASLADLVAALASPVMEEMRADGRKFPPFTGKATHFPMRAWRIDGRG